MKKKTLVLTIAIGKDYQKMAKITHPSIKAYAEKIGADFKCIDQQAISKTTPHWEKFQIFELLNTYDRILYLDTDLIVREDCPNLFEEVPENKLGAFNEAKFTERSKELMIDICRKYDVQLPEWDGRYFNSGVMVISKQHKFLFKKPEKEIFSFYEQSYLNMMIAKDEILMHELEYKLNRMTCMDRFTGEDRHASYIVHYAGYPNLAWVLDMIPKDIKKWGEDKETGYKYKRHLYISVNGGLGDQIASEQPIRFLKEKLYPDDEIVVATHWPRIFKHFEKLGITVVEHGKADLSGDNAYFLKSTLPGPETVQWAIVSHLMCHCVDYISMALMKRTLPIKDKQLKLEVELKDVANLMDVIGDQKFDVAVHCGRHWDSKTFPVEYWQEIIDGLVHDGKKVCLIGQDSAGDPPDYVAGARGTVDVECPEGAVDLRNLLDLGSSLALLSMTKVLISNDSAPIHMASAFSNWIVLIPSCKHPDHILHWRNGNQYYKAVALYKKLALDDIESRPTQVSETSAEFNVKEWNEYLLDSKEVVNKILEIK